MAAHMKRDLFHAPISVGSIVLSLLFVSMSLTDVQAQTWKTYTYTADGFQVDFSGNVVVSPTELGSQSSPNIVRSTEYSQDGGIFAYLVDATLAKASGNFQGGVSASYGYLKCATTTSDKTLPIPQGQAREISGTNCGGGSIRVETRYFAVEKMFYQVLALFQINGGDAAAARHFVESFKLIGQ
jgi:hypothetical protein